MNGNNNGWVPLWRKVLDNEVWQFHPQAWRVYEALLLLCDQRTGVWNGGRKRLSGVVNLTESATYRSLQLLQKKNMIFVENANNRFSRISICKMSEYKAISEQRPNNDRTTTEQRPNTITRIKNKELRNINVNPNGSTKDLFFELVKELGYTDDVQYTDARRRKLQARLKRFEPGQLKEVAKAIYASPFHQGDNPSGKRYGTIDFLLRSDEKVDEWLNEKNQQMTRKADW